MTVESAVTCWSRWIYRLSSPAPRSTLAQPLAYRFTLVIAFASSHGLVATDDAVIVVGADQHGVVAVAEVGGVVAATGDGQDVVAGTHVEAVAARRHIWRSSRWSSVIGARIGHDIIAFATDDEVIQRASDDGVVAVTAIDEGDASTRADPVIAVAERNVLGVVGGTELDMVIAHGANVDDLFDGGCIVASDSRVAIVRVGKVKRQVAVEGLGVDQFNVDIQRRANGQIGIARDIDGGQLVTDIQVGNGVDRGIAVTGDRIRIVLRIDVDLLDTQAGGASC